MIRERPVFYVQDARIYRLRLMRAAGVLLGIVLVLSFGAAWRIADWRMVFACVPVWLASGVLVMISSRELRSTGGSVKPDRPVEVV